MNTKQSVTSTAKTIEAQLLQALQHKLIERGCTQEDTDNAVEYVKHIIDNQK